METTPTPRLQLSGRACTARCLPLLTYFYETYDPTTGTYLRTNDDLGFSRSIHTILGYDWTITPKLRLKLEGYYQHVYAMPVQRSGHRISAWPTRARALATFRWPTAWRTLA
jgi:hypothetical protein